MLDFTQAHTNIAKLRLRRLTTPTTEVSVTTSFISIRRNTTTTISRLIGAFMNGKIRMSMMSAAATAGRRRIAVYGTAAATTTARIPQSIVKVEHVFV